MNYKTDHGRIAARMVYVVADCGGSGERRKKMVKIERGEKTVELTGWDMGRLLGFFLFFIINYWLEFIIFKLVVIIYLLQSKRAIFNIITLNHAICEPFHSKPFRHVLKLCI